MNRTHTSHSPQETRSIARAFATRLSVGETIALIGPLGAGKTEFVKGIVEGFGSSDITSSPTFTLLHEYHTPKTIIYHLDLYRLKTPDEIYHLGLEDLHDGIVLIEWADRFRAILPNTYWQITMISGPITERTIQIEKIAKAKKT